jgi:rhodanese-related sulfurtransferase/DNA-binding transcriptional ArsR family regulator
LTTHPNYYSIQLNILMMSEKREFKDAVYEQLARAGKALSSPKRVEMLDLLTQRPRTVEALAAEVDTTVANASQHLQILVGSGLVEAKKTGRFVCYRLADAKVAEFLRTFRVLAERRLAEIEQIKRRFLHDPESFEPVDEETLLQRIRQGGIVTIDVRPVEEYQHAHLSGAISLPLGELRNRLDELPRDKQIVAYCRGPYCLMAPEAVRILRSHGFQAYRLEAGIADLGAIGFPIVEGQMDLSACTKFAAGYGT